MDALERRKRDGVLLLPDGDDLPVRAGFPPEDQLEDADGRVSKALGLLAKGVEVYDYLQEMHLTDTLEMYGRLDETRQAQFIGLINNPEGESK